MLYIYVCTSPYVCQCAGAYVYSRFRPAFQMFEHARHDRRQGAGSTLTANASTASLMNASHHHSEESASSSASSSSSSSSSASPPSTHKTKLGCFGVVGLHSPDLPVALRDLVPSLSVRPLHAHTPMLDLSSQVKVVLLRTAYHLQSLEQDANVGMHNHVFSLNSEPHFVSPNKMFTHRARRDSNCTRRWHIVYNSVSKRRTASRPTRICARRHRPPLTRSTRRTTNHRLPRCHRLHLHLLPRRHSHHLNRRRRRQRRPRTHRATPRFAATAVRLPRPRRRRPPSCTAFDSRL